MKNFIENVVDFKKKAWNTEDSARAYQKNVEHVFFNTVTVKLFEEFIKKGDKVLDIGAGTGRLSLALAKLGCDVVASDISSSMLQVIDEQKRQLPVTTLQCEGEKIPLEDAQFDVVTSMDLLAHFPQWQSFLKEKVRLAKKEGYIIYTAYNGDNFKFITPELDFTIISEKFVGNNQFIFTQTPKEIREFCQENSLEVVKIQPFELFTGTCLWCEHMTAKDMQQFRELFGKALKNNIFQKIIQEFESQIVAKLPPEVCARIFVVLRKK